jgi:hypothetical protein
MPSTIGDFVTINNPNKGKTLTKHRRFLDKCHMDIVYGDCLSLGGYRYALLIVDVATRFCWLFGLTSLCGNDIVILFRLWMLSALRLMEEFPANSTQTLTEN